jgi:ribonuclease HII
MPSRKSSTRPEQITLSFEAPGLLAGVDEAGRGPLAGPVVAAAVILDDLHPIAGLADSKALSAKRRERLFDEIRAKALCFKIAEASVEEIDELNILHATMLAMKRAVPAISAASILAKVHRDQLCAEMHRAYPAYGFAGHKGYPTPEHLAALRAHGATPLHRQSFGPVREALATGGHV